MKDEFFEYLEQYLRRPEATRRTAKYGLQRIERWSGLPIEKVTAETCLEFIRSAPYPLSTIQTTLSQVKNFHKFGAAKEYWRLNGIMAVQVPKFELDTKPSLAPDESWAFLDACRTPNEYRVAWLGHFVGTRVSEAARMDVDMLIDDRWRFRGSKTGRVREVPVHEQLRQVVGRFLEEPNRGPRALEYAVERLKDRTGIYTCSGSSEPVTSQAFRRTFSTSLLEADVPLWMVECLMGHKSSSMTMKAYASIPFRRKKAAVGRLRYGNGQMRLW